MVLPLVPLQALAVNSAITTDDFVVDLKKKIAFSYQVEDSNIFIDWQDELLEIKLEKIRKYYPDNSIDVRLKDIIVSTIAGRKGLPLELYIDGKLNRILFIKCEIDVMKKALVAVENIKKGVSVSNENITYSKVSVKKLQGSSENLTFSDLVNMVAARDITKDTVITSNLLKEKTVILKGNQVTIRVLNGSLTLTSVGEALQDGYMGQNIRVKVVAFGSNKVIMARVIDLDLVEINMGGNK